MSLREWLRLIVVYLSIPLILLSVGGDAQWWQAWVFALLMALSVSFPLVVVAGLDHRFGWSLVFAVWLNNIGVLLCHRD